MKMLGKRKIEQIAEGLGWGVQWGKKCVCFSKYSPCGQDYSIDISFEKVSDILENIYTCIENYDPSYEAYIWLDETGHGKNGAPYEMIDVYNDMLSCKEMTEELYDALKQGDRI